MLKYETPTMEIINYLSKDVLTASGEFEIDQKDKWFVE